MQNSVKKMLRQMFRDKKRQQRVVAVICALSVLVATGVFNQLMQPVITMTPDPICGIAEHAHISECYQQQLVCGGEESEEHAHADGCYENVLACGQSEHVHSDSCYPEEIKEQPVITAEPTEAPAEPTEVPAVPATVSEDEGAAESTAEPEATDAPEVTAEPEATEAPEVTEAPEATAEPEVTEAPTEEPTAEPVAPVISAAAASAESVFVGQTVTWTFEVSGAAELTYIIADAEGNQIVNGALDAAATHVSWLADRAGAFTLTITAANENGSVTASGAVTVEAAVELTAAVRSDSASAFAGESVTFHFAVSGGVEPANVSIVIDQDGETIAALDEFAESVSVAPEYVGDKVANLIATITAADSVGATVADSVQIPVAVRMHETESDWVKATETELTDDWRENLLAVAETQLGYEESALDFVIDDEGNKQGYTRYGQWWGASHDEWCAMFISFCLNYAEIPEQYFPREAGCEKWIGELKYLGLYADEDYAPEAGDLIFFDWEDDGVCDHVGIVTKADSETIETIEGNSGACVRTCEYETGDETIIGFGRLTKAYERWLADELELDLETGVGAQARVTADAILRAEPASDSMEIAALTAETLVTVNAAEQNLAEVWYEITFADLTGYLPAEALELNYIAIEDLVPVEEDGNAGIMTLEAEADTITVTFEIDNSDYVSDPDSGETHLKIVGEDIVADYQENGLTVELTPWSGQSGTYKVTGTGVLVKRTIDAGTALGELPTGLEVYNASNTSPANKYTYISSRNWQTEAGQVCTKNTVLSEDTTLYLKLIEENTNYSLNYVCGCNSNHSLDYVTNSTFTNLIAPGQSLSAEEIPSADFVNDNFRYENCACGPLNGQRFVKWQLKKASDNSMVDLTAGLALTSDYLASDAERTIRIYPVWEDVDSYILTFVADGVTVATRNIEIGYPITVFPEVKKDGYVCTGWVDKDGNAVTEETVVTFDTTLYAVFEEAYTVTFMVDGEVYTTLDVAVGGTGGSDWPTLANIDEYEWFACWVDADGNEYYSWTEINTDSLVLYPVWKRDAVTLAFYQYNSQLAGPSSIDWYNTVQYNTYKGLKFSEVEGFTDFPVPNQFDGYICTGWRNNNNSTEFFTLDTVITDSKTIVPAYVQADYTVNFVSTVGDVTETVSYYVADGAALSAAKDKTGATITALPTPSVNADNFLGWSVDGGSTYADLTTAITADTTFTAVFQSAASVTVTFKYNSQTASCEVPSGTTLAEALVLAGAEPAASEVVTLEDGTMETRLFSGWSYVVVPEGAADGEYVAAATDMAITADMEFTAVYQAQAGYTVTFHDIGTDGKTEQGDATIDVLVPAGEALADYLADVVLYDETSAADVLWYNGTANDETGVIAKGDQITADYIPTANVDLYTFTYQITLQLASTQTAEQVASLLDYLMPAAYAEVEVVPNEDGTAITITARESDTLTAEDFVVNGVDYSQYTVNGTALSAYIGKGLSDLIADTGATANEDGSYTIAVTAPTLYTINYDINHGLTPTSDTMLNSVIPTIGGALTTSDTYSSSSTADYVVRTPSRIEYFVENTTSDANSTRHWVYEFAGWADGDADATTVVFEAGTSVTVAEMTTHAGDDGVLNLVAVWDAKNENTNSGGKVTGDYNDVNFFIAKAVAFKGDGSASTDNWTGSLYATTTEDDMYSVYNVTSGVIPAAVTVIAGSDTIGTGANDPEVLENGSDAYPDVVGVLPRTAGVLTYFPSDEYIFAQLRKDQEANGSIKWNDANSTTVAVSDLNSNNFDIFWTVYKTETWGIIWHVDGVLMPKKAKLVVEKEFYGDQTSIDTIKNSGNYSITVTDGSDTHTLTLSNADNDGDATDNSYTWTLTTLNRNTKYTITETGHTSDSLGDGIATLAEYMVTNTNGTETELTAGKWYTYSSGITVNPISYQKEVSSSKYQTVTLLNSYLPTDSVAVWKVDATSGEGLAGATFKIEKLTDGKWSDYTVYQNPNTTTKKEYYMYDPVADIANRTSTTTLSFDSTGNLTLIGLKDAQRSGTYRLTEVVAPAGYKRIETPIQFELTVTTDGVQSFTVDEHTNASIANNRVLRITNDSTPTSVTVQKIWADGDTLEEVQLKLWLGDDAVSESITLDGVVDEKEKIAWTYTWSDLPLIVNGQAAQYFVEEERIGSTYHSLEADSDDGYENYIVTMSPITYSFEDDGSTNNTSISKTVNGETVYADNALLVVHNAVFKNDIRFLKTGAGVALSGAGFTLYSDAACTQMVKTATSDTNGAVVFEDVNPGTYYMKETLVPAGYQDNAMIYQVVVTFESVKIYETSTGADNTLTPATTAITTINNTPDVKVNLTLKKTALDKTTTLSGAQFKLQKLNATNTYENLGSEVTTASNGTYSWSDLEEGSYQLVETKAPDGYYLNADPIQFVISADGTVAFPTGVTYSNAELSGTSPDVTITVTNTPGVELPSTGGAGTYSYTIGGLLLMAASLLYGIGQRRKRERGEEI